MSSLDPAYERERTKRLFINTVGSAFGVEQSFAETDALPINRPGQYSVYGNTYGYATEGQAVSQSQTGGMLPLVLLLVAGVVIYKLVR